MPALSPQLVLPGLRALGEAISPVGRGLYSVLPEALKARSPASQELTRRLAQATKDTAAFREAGTAPYQQNRFIQAALEQLRQPTDINPGAEGLLKPALSSPGTDAAAIFFAQPEIHMLPPELQQTLYLQYLGSRQSGLGKEVIQQIQNQYPGKPIALEAYKRTGADEAYKRMGFDYANVADNDAAHPWMVLDKPLQKAEGGPVKMEEGGSPGANMTAWDGTSGTSLAEWANNSLPSATWNKQAQEGVGSDALLGSLPIGKILSSAAKALPSATVAGLAAGAGNAEAGKASAINPLLEELLRTGKRINGALDLSALPDWVLKELSLLKKHGDLVFSGHGKPIEEKLISAEKPLFVAQRPNHALAYALEGDTPVIYPYSAPSWGKWPSADAYFELRGTGVNPLADPILRNTPALRSLLEYGGGRTLPGAYTDFAAKGKGPVRGLGLVEHSNPQGVVTAPERVLIKRAEGGPVRMGHGGVLGSVYSTADAFKRGLKDFASHPLDYLRMMDDRAKNYNENVSPEVSNGSLHRRPLTEEEKQQKAMDIALNVGPMGVGVIKGKGGNWNWINGSVEDALARLKQTVPGVRSAENPRLEEVARNATVNSWIDGPLTKYVRNDMATPNDPLRANAERGVLHFTPPAVPPGVNSKVVSKRMKAGFPQFGMAESPLATSWENLADAAIRPQTALDLSSAERAASFGGKSSMPPETIVHSMNPFASGAQVADLGFPHLIDELGNSLGTDLPAAFQLKDLRGMTVPQASEHVAKINKWREAQAAKARQAAAEGIPVHSTHDSGHKILAVPDVTADPKAMQFVNDTGKEAGWCTQAESAAKTYAGGDSRVFVVQNDIGKPVAQIQVGHKPQDPRFEAPEDLQDTWRAEAGRAARSAGIKSGSEDEMYFVENHVGKLADDWANSLPTDVPPSILQIKGKFNGKVADEDLPAVHQFIKSQPWSDVRDLGNTGLRRISDVFNANEIQKIKDAGVELPAYASPEEIKSIGRQVWPDEILYQEAADPKLLSRGGSVHAQGAQLLQHFANGGPVRPSPAPGTETMTIGTRGRAPQNMQEWYDIFEKETA